MQDKIKIDLKTGLRIETVPYDAKGEDIIETPCTESFYLPCWNGETWEEGASQEYIDSLKSQAEPTGKSLEEKVAEHDTKIVTMEEAIDVIFGGV